MLITCHSLENEKKKNPHTQAQFQNKEKHTNKPRTKKNNLYQSKQIGNY